MPETHDRPTAPDTIPKYVREGVERQDADALRDLAVWADRLAEWKDRDLTEEDVLEATGDDEIVEDVDQADSGGTVVKKKIPCGKKCSGCPHGPYRYRAYRVGDTVKTEYLGKA